jgi:TolB-like protein
MLLLLASLGQAATVAVLPLEQGATSEQYEGLGVPLAGMLTADLAQAPGLTLVERQRLDALLGEIELGESGYLDPATALRAGRGAGAEWVVVGSYSVIDGQLLLEARMVSVESSTVVQAGQASGPVADFVAVEKDLVDALLDELDVELSSGARRRIVLQAPTEAWAAIAAYGAGVAAEQAGRGQEAESSYAKALLVDPDYDEARAALAELRSGLEAREEARLEAAVDAWHQARLDILEAVPAETSRPADFRHDPESHALFGLRLTALKQLDRDCERYDELYAYAAREGLPADGPIQELVATSEELWVEHGLVESLSKAKGSTWKSSPSLWRSPVHYLFDLDGWLADPRIANGDGLLGSLHACFPPEERGARVGDARALLASSGHGGAAFGSAGVTLDQALRFHEAWEIAGGGGLDAGVQADLEALLAELSGDARLGEWADQQLGRVLDAAATWERRQAAMLGLDAEALWGVTRAYAEGGGGLVKTEGAICEEALRQKQDQARMRVEQLRSGEHKEEWLLEQLWFNVASPRDLGCIEGVPARFTSAEEVYRWGHSAPERAVPEHLERCAPEMERVARSFDMDQVTRNAGNPQINAVQAVVALDAYYRTLVIPGCVTD